MEVRGLVTRSRARPAMTRLHRTSRNAWNAKHSGEGSIALHAARSLAAVLSGYAAWQTLFPGSVQIVDLFHPKEYLKGGQGHLPCRQRSCGALIQTAA
jgi:hypothetical protein